MELLYRTAPTVGLKVQYLPHYLDFGKQSLLVRALQASHNQNIVVNIGDCGVNIDLVGPHWHHLGSKYLDYSRSCLELFDGHPVLLIKL